MRLINFKTPVTIRMYEDSDQVMVTVRFRHAGVSDEDGWDLRVGRGCSETDAALDAVKQIFGTCLEDAADLTLVQLSPKCERKARSSVAASHTRWSITLSYRGHGFTGNGFDQVSIKAFAISLFEASNKIVKMVERGGIPPRSFEGLPTRGI